MRLTAFTDFGLHALMRLARGPERRLRADPALPHRGPLGRITQGDGMRADRRR